MLLLLILFLLKGWPLTLNKDFPMILFLQSYELRLLFIGKLVQSRVGLQGHEKHRQHTRYSGNIQVYL